MNFINLMSFYHKTSKKATLASRPSAVHLRRGRAHAALVAPAKVRQDRSTRKAGMTHHCPQVLYCEQDAQDYSLRDQKELTPHLSKITRCNVTVQKSTCFSTYRQQGVKKTYSFHSNRNKS